MGGRARGAGQEQAGRPATGPARLPDENHRARYAAEREKAAARPRGDGVEPATADLGPGREESGGYVDPERHRY